MGSSTLLILGGVGLLGLCVCIGLAIWYFNSQASSPAPSTGSPPTGSPVAGSPVAGSPPTGSPVAGSPPTGSPVAGSPASSPSRPETSNYGVRDSPTQGCLTTPEQYNAAMTACGAILGGDTMGLNRNGCWRCLKMNPNGLHPGTDYSIRYAI